MQTAPRTIDSGQPAGTGEDDIALRKRELALERLGICRDAIERIDTVERDSWRQMVCELIDGGFDEGEIERELAASRNTIYKWKTGMAAPREMTRRLLRRAMLELVDRRIADLDAAA